jgi:WD40 repeat protein
VRVFQPDIGHQDRNVPQHSGSVRCVSFAANGRMIASGSFDKPSNFGMRRRVHVCTHFTVIPIRLILSRFRQTLHSSRPGQSTELCGSGAFMPMVQTRIRVCTPSTAIPMLIRSVAFSPDSSLIASGSYDTTVRIWSLHDPSTVRILKGHDIGVVCVRFSPDGRRIVSVSYTLEIIVWDVEKSEQLAIWPSSSHGELHSRVSFSADGSCVIMEFRDVMKSWKMVPSAECSSEHIADSPSSKPPSKAISIPIVLVPIPDEDLSISHDMPVYRYPRENEWILDQQNRRIFGYQQIGGVIRLIIMTERSF